MSIGMNVVFLIFFFFNDTATTEIYTLSLHDALPIFVFQAYFPWKQIAFLPLKFLYFYFVFPNLLLKIVPDRKSTRLNSSHANISYAVFCLKKKKNKLQLLSILIKIMQTVISNNLIL